MFSEVGKKTPIAVRFSTTSGESGSSDTVRNIRGFAIKFYTEDGIWDLVGNNVPIFWFRDPALFPSFTHSQKRNPATHLKDANMFWDFLSLKPETTPLVLLLFSDLGIPDSYRHMDGFGTNTFRLINANAETFYCKFHYKTDQGIKNLTVERASELASKDPDYGIRDLYNAIAKKQYPSWSFYIQIMTHDEANEVPFNPFDSTKRWPEIEFPLIPVGKLVLDRNPTNNFAEVEQLAFNPGNFVPGIGASPDKILQGRLFSYPDTQRHRLGPNHLQLPVNCPCRVSVSTKNYQRDGAMCFTDNQGGAPNYFPNSFGGPKESEYVRKFNRPEKICGHAYRYRMSSEDEDNFSQASTFYNNLSSEEKSRLIDNLSENLAGALQFIQKRAIHNFYQVNSDFALQIAKNLALNTTIH